MKYGFSLEPSLRSRSSRKQRNSVSTAIEYTPKKALNITSFQRQPPIPINLTSPVTPWERLKGKDNLTERNRDEKKRGAKNIPLKD